MILFPTSHILHVLPWLPDACPYCLQVPKATRVYLLTHLQYQYALAARCNLSTGPSPGSSPHANVHVHIHVHIPSPNLTPTPSQPAPTLNHGKYPIGHVQIVYPNAPGVVVFQQCRLSTRLQKRAQESRLGTPPSIYPVASLSRGLCSPGPRTHHLQQELAVKTLVHPEPSLAHTCTYTA
jgi:hypothetical protein